MKLKFIVLSAVLCMTAFSCADKNGGSYSSPEVSESSAISSVGKEYSIPELPDSREAFEETFKDVPDADEGALLSVGNTTAKAGEIAEVTVSVKNVDLKWNMCGVHLIYPDVLSCVYPEDDDKILEYEKGEAIKHNFGVIAMEWKKEDSPPEELVRSNLSTMFFTVTFNANDGKDGDIITLYLKVPEDAESGTVYPVDFYYMNGDMFKNFENEPSFEKYAFGHTQAGSITVE